MPPSVPDIGLAVVLLEIPLEVLLGVRDTKSRQLQATRAKVATTTHLACRRAVKREQAD
jgi:hypothetical protein